MKKAIYDPKENPFISEDEYVNLMQLEPETKSAKKTEIRTNPIENFEVIPDTYEIARPRIIVRSNE